MKKEIRRYPELFLDLTGRDGHELDLIGLGVLGGDCVSVSQTG